MCKQARKALKGTDPWEVGYKGYGKRIKSRGQRRAGKAYCRESRGQESEEFPRVAAEDCYSVGPFVYLLYCWDAI